MKRLHADTTRPQIIEALGTSRTWDAAALSLGLYDHAVLRKRVNSLGIFRRRVRDVTIVEVWP